ncbi:hypothetical protein [Streptomyces sp. NPDC088180]|uniref:hypothetical protein n=1 Tax=Streptomyces sp. NPDC088180 TaxID=3365837 RepID=UPI0037F7CD6F
MPPLPSKRTTWHSLLNPLTRRNRSAPAAEAAPAIGPCPAVALYAVVPLQEVAHLTLDDLAAYAQDRGWIVPTGCAVADTGALTQDLDGRRGWNRVRALATGTLIQGVVVPSLTHIAYRAADSDREQAWLLKQRLFVVATNPTELDLRA